MNEFKLTIITPQGLIREGHVHSLVAPGAHGSFGILASHAPMMVALSLGIFKVRDNKGEHFYVIEPGLLEVNQNGEVVALVDHAVRFDSLIEAKEHLKAEQLI